MTKRTRSWRQVIEMSFLHRVAGLSLRTRVRGSVTWEKFRVEPLLLHSESRSWWSSGTSLEAMFRACPTGTRPRVRPRARCKVWGTPWVPPGRAGGSAWGPGSLGRPAQTAASATWPQIMLKAKDGWNRRTCKFGKVVEIQWTQRIDDIVSKTSASLNYGILQRCVDSSGGQGGADFFHSKCMCSSFRLVWLNTE